MHTTVKNQSSQSLDFNITSVEVEGNLYKKVSDLEFKSGDLVMFNVEHDNRPSGLYDVIVTDLPKRKLMLSNIGVIDGGTHLVRSACVVINGELSEIVNGFGHYDRKKGRFLEENEIFSRFVRI